MRNLLGNTVSKKTHRRNSLCVLEIIEKDNLAYNARVLEPEEHPQNPNQAENHARLEDEYLNNFGNLCIMSRNQNSLRSNLMPQAKIKEFGAKNQSLKFEIMEAITNKNGWDVEEILKHGDEMRELLSEFVSK